MRKGTISMAKKSLNYSQGIYACIIWHLRHMTRLLETRNGFFGLKSPFSSFVYSYLSFLSIKWFLPLNLNFYSIFHFFLCFCRYLIVIYDYVIIRHLLCSLVFI